jgi:hypothetical protein
MLQLRDWQLELERQKTLLGERRVEGEGERVEAIFRPQLRILRFKSGANHIVVSCSFIKNTPMRNEMMQGRGRTSKLSKAEWIVINKMTICQTICIEFFVN